ncbi:fatty acid--CoA ligase family protein [Streptomyces erythrochromogenes]|uniref:class I adenylate-forming enzyme family protein n=1 Tax=Streptomyces erythrochromogenes TaxID=285574 RepID=UPI00331A727C
MPDGLRRLADAVIGSGGRLNEAVPRDTRKRIAQCAARYGQAGVSDGDLVLLAGLAPDDVLEAAVACWSVGAAVWVTPRKLNEVRVDHASFVVTAGLVVERCGKASGAHDDVAVVHETSGSTGQPKLARRSVDSVFAEHIGYREGLSLDTDDTVRVPVSVEHSFGFGVALSALLSGCRVDVRPLTTPTIVATDLDRGRATKVALSPALMRLLTRTVRRGASRPRAVLVGAGPVSHALDSECLARFGVAITRGYGSSETGGIFIGAKGIGRPIRSVEILLPEVGSRGELVVRTPFPVLGYMHEEVGQSSVWHTGDLVERDASGQVSFVERKPGAVRANGRFVDVGPVQTALSAIKGVEDVTFAVVPRPGQSEFEDIYAVVVGRQVCPDTVEKTIRANTHVGFTPRVRIFEELPRTGLGKLDRAALVEWIRRDG